jgi:hypothetical protein
VPSSDKNGKKFYAQSGTNLSEKSYTLYDRVQNNLCSKARLQKFWALFGHYMMGTNMGTNICTNIGTNLIFPKIGQFEIGC